MAVAAPVTAVRLDGGNNRIRKCLPFSLDLSCPIALPSRASHVRPWPYAVAGPSTAPQESTSSFLRRRYLETLYMTDILFPIDHLVQDVLGLSSSTSPDHALADTIRPLLLTLPQVETRHRKSILPLLSACSAAVSNPSSDLAKELVDDAINASTLDSDEKDVIRVAMELRQSSRVASEGAVADARKLRGELEKRETLIQVVLLFLYISHAAPAAEKKRKRDKRRSEPPSVVDNPHSALEVLMDRLSVWSAISELESGPAIAENSTQVMLQAFWSNVIQPFCLPTQRDLCASFHLKVFAAPLPPDTLAVKEAATAKKSRKPTMTRARPSSDALTQPDFRPPDSRSISGHRSLSRAPSETGSRRSNSRDRSLSRSLSARPTESLEMRRSRSKSIDPAPGNDTARQSAPKKGLMRAPSGGKDLFKGRQVGLLKRNSSLIARRPSQRESQSQQGSLGRSESLARVGLLGRKTSDPKGRRNSEESQSQTTQPGTLVFATPSKPKLADSIFGPRLGFAVPTPIREEPSSSERPTYIAETPRAFGRVSGTVDAGVAETPQTSTRSFVPSTGRSYAGMAINALNSIERVVGSDEESDLGDLMVMTDEEGDED